VTRRQALKSQAGFTLLEVMFASLALAGLMAGLATYLRIESTNVRDLVLRQQASYVANAQMERISALYVYSNFGVTGPKLTSGYTEIAAFPSSRYIYPSNLSDWTSSGPDIISTGTGNFSGKEFNILYLAGASSALDRSYVWVDQSTGVVGRISWTATNIVTASCADGGDCLCSNYSGVGGGYCQKLTLYLEYPYRISNGAVAASGALQTVTLSTIVGRGE
jgi:prepilin-type N-terminal cleavage/methylation domain-containing protein